MEILNKNIEPKEPMKRNFTLKLIPFIYHETTAEENALLIDEILTDAACADVYDEMIEAKEMLNSARMRPSRSSIERILNFSREYCETP